MNPLHRFSGSKVVLAFFNKDNLGWTVSYDWCFIRPYKVPPWAIKLRNKIYLESKHNRVTRIKSYIILENNGLPHNIKTQEKDKYSRHISDIGLVYLVSSALNRHFVISANVWDTDFRFRQNILAPFNFCCIHRGGRGQRISQFYEKDRVLEKPHLVGHSVLLNNNVVKTFSHLATGPGKSFCYLILDQ